MSERDDDVETVRVLVTMLVDLRHRLNVSQVELSERSGLAQSSISRLESRPTSPQLLTLIRYARGLGVQLTLDWRGTREPLVSFDEQLAAYDRRDAARAERFETIAERMIRTHD